MSNFSEYITLKTNHGHIDIRINTSENAIDIKARYDSTQEGEDSIRIHKNFLLDDPELGTKVGNIWDAFKTKMNGLTTHAISQVEANYVDYVQSLNE